MNGTTPLREALERRAPLLAELGPDTDAVRLLHGVAEGVPGLTVDRYGKVLLIQTFREPVSATERDAIHQTVCDALGVELIAVHNHRGKAKAQRFEDFHDPELPEGLECREHGLVFDARPRTRGIDPLLFLDFRVARRKIRAVAKGRSVLNTFAYTCGIGVAALAGGAKEAVNLDFARSALDIGKANAARNGLTGFKVLASDYFPAIRQFAGLGVGGRASKRPPYAKVERRQFDIVVLDPPRWAKSAWGAVDVVRDYSALLKPALLTTKPGGHLLATNNHAGVDREDWLAVLQKTAEKAGRPIADVELLTPDADFPSFDGKHPLKMAWLTVS